MSKVLCIGTCYMPVKKGRAMPVERYEDEWGDMGDVYDIPDNRLKEFMDTGDFQNVIWDDDEEVFRIVPYPEAIPREG